MTETEHQIHVTTTLVHGSAGVSVHTCTMTGFTEAAARIASNKLIVGRQNTIGEPYTRAIVVDTGRPFVNDPRPTGLAALLNSQEGKSLDATGHSRCGSRC